MSSMLKKKGTLSFKPKVPSVRRTAGPGPPVSAPASNPRQSVDRQSQTPAPSVRAPSAVSPPPSVVPLQSNEGHLSPPPVASALNEAPEHPPLQPVPPLSPHTKSSTQLLPPPLLKDSAEFQTVIDPLPPHARQDGVLLDRSAFSAEHATPEEAPPGKNISNPATLPPQLEPGPSHSISGARPFRGESQIPPPAANIAIHQPRIILPTPNTLVGGTSETTQPLSTPELLSARSTGDANAPENVDLSTLGAGESIQASQLVPLAPLNPDGTSGDIIAESAQIAAHLAKRRRVNDAEDDIRPTIEVQIHKRRRVQGVGRQARKQKEKDGPKKKRKRAETPEDAEHQEVDRATMKMAELCKDIKIGRKFSKHAEIKQRDMERKVKAKLARENPELVAIEENRNPSNDMANQEVIEDPSDGVQMRLVNGQIVIDDRSLVVDRHARAAAAAEVMEEVEENEFTRITTSGTHMKREKAIVWNFESEEKFYDGLRMFGTDFEMISKMFPDRNRRQIKLKFNKEERAHPTKVKKALIGEKVAIDLEEYKAHTGLEYEDTKTITDEYQKVEEEHAAEEAEHEARAAEEIRKKKAAIQGTSDNYRGEGMGGADSAKENEPDRQDGKASAASKSRKKGVGKKKRNLHSVRGGGEDVEVLGTL